MRPHTRIFKKQHDLAVATAGSLGLAVYTALARLRSDCRKDKELFPAGAALIARLAGCSTRSVKRVIPQLADAGLITITSGRRIEGEKKQELNRYTLILETVSSATQSPPSSAAQSPPVGTEAHGLKPLRGFKRKKARHAGVAAEAAPAGGQEKIHPDFDYL